MWPATFILNFHGLGLPGRSVDAGERAYWLATDTFERALVVARQLESRKGVRFRFTFDDGNASDDTLARPLLESKGFRAAFFVLAGRIGEAGSLAPEQVRSLVAAGHEIGSHGYGHIDLRQASESEMKRELVEARELIEGAAGSKIDSISIPFGLFDRNVVAAIRKAGYKRIYTSSGGFAAAQLGLIPRTTLRADFNPERDLPAMIATKVRLKSAVVDPLRRLKHGGW